MLNTHVWNDRLQLGDEALDGEHHLQIAMVDALAQALEQRRPSMAQRLADQLAQYTAAHFDGEQLLMEASGYAGLGDHAAEHRSMLVHIGEIRELLQGGEYDLALPMALDLLNGLGSHIVTSDRRFTDEHPSAGWRQVAR